MQPLVSQPWCSTAPAWPTATFGSATKLFIADHRQYWPQPLVIGDSALVDVADLVKGAVSEINAVIADRKPAVGMVNDGYPLADCRLGLRARRQDEDHFVVLQCQRLREGALLFPGKRVFQIVADAQRPVQILFIRRQLGKARVVVGHERREQGVPLSQSARTSQPQLLDQPILQRLMRPLDPTLRLARIGADDVDVESVQRPPELGHPITTERASLVDTKHPMLVAVEGDQLSPGFEVGAGGSEISKGRLALDKPEVHQATGRVVDEHEQCTAPRL